MYLLFLKNKTLFRFILNKNKLDVILKFQG